MFQILGACRVERLAALAAEGLIGHGTIGAQLIIVIAIQLAIEIALRDHPTAVQT
jgi:hypothetical protein